MFTGDPRMTEILTLNAEKLMQALDSGEEEQSSNHDRSLATSSRATSGPKCKNTSVSGDRNHKGPKCRLEWRELVATRYTILQATHHST